MVKSLEYIIDRMTLSKTLGFTDNAKLLIIHADDAGLSHSENSATINSLKNGVVNSYSIMVPCPWFYEMAQYAKNFPAFDHGVHLTLTCEWNQYKFGPVLSPEEVPSLVDEKGYFFKDRQSLVQKAEIDDLRKELRAQIDRALFFGLQPSHLDSHMYALGASREFLDLYREIGEEYRLPVMLNGELIKQVSGLDLQGLDLGKTPQIEHLYLGYYDAFIQGKLAEYYLNSIHNLKAGLNLILIHPAYDDPEMRAITIDHPNFGAQWRQTDLDFFTSDACKLALKKEKVQLITWQAIKDLIYP